MNTIATYSHQHPIGLGIGLSQGLVQCQIHTGKPSQ